MLHAINYSRANLLFCKIRGTSPRQPTQTPPTPTTTKGTKQQKENKNSKTNNQSPSHPQKASQIPTKDVVILSRRELNPGLERSRGLGSPDDKLTY